MTGATRVYDVLRSCCRARATTDAERRGEIYGGGHLCGENRWKAELILGPAGPSDGLLSMQRHLLSLLVAILRSWCAAHPALPAVLMSQYKRCHSQSVCTA